MGLLFVVDLLHLSLSRYVLLADAGERVLDIR